VIIRFPTGLFRTVLPTETGPGNVIFTVSNNSPPRVSTTTLQLPVASTVRLRESDVTDEERRLSVGERVFTITSGFKVNPGSNKRAFEIGQLLDFSDDLTQTIEPLKLPADIVIQHNNNLFDLGALGLTEDQIQELIDRSTEKFNELKISLASLQSEAKDLGVQIAENQKAINEQVKVIEVTKVVLDATNPINVDLADKLTVLRTQRDELIAAQMAKNLEAQEVYNQLLTISTVVK
jgi:hypothetical protein